MTSESSKTAQQVSAIRSYRGVKALTPPIAAVFFSFFILSWFTTSNLGVGTSPDSGSYLSIAENLRKRLDYRDYSEESNPHFPPLYPAMIAMTSAATFRDVRHGAPRLLSAFSFALFGAMSYATLRSATGSTILSCIGCLAIAAQSELVKLGSSVLTEIPFMVFSIGGGIALFIWSRNRLLTLLLISAALFSLACLTRYVGVVWPATALLFIVTDRAEKKFTNRIRNMVTFGAIAYSPMALWLAYWKFSGISPGGRSLNWHPLSADAISIGLQTLADSVGLNNPALPAVILAAFAATICNSLILRWKRQKLKIVAEKKTCLKSNFPFSLPIFMSAFAISYLGFLVFSISFIDRATPLNGRILSPVIWIIIILLFYYVAHLAKIFPHTRNTVGLFLFLQFFSILIFQVVPRISEWHSHGIDLSHDSIKYDQNLRKIREMDLQNRTLFSNVPWTVYLTTGKNARTLPSKEDYTSGFLNLNYVSELASIINATKTGDAITILDITYSDPHYLTPTYSELNQLGFEELHSNRESPFMLIGLSHAINPTAATDDARNQ